MPAAPDLAALAAQWTAEIDAAEREPDRQRWLERARTLIRLYREERAAVRPGRARKRFALFWAQIQTVGPAIYAKAPLAVVGRRFDSDDAVARTASEVLERAINFAIETTGFGQTLMDCRDEYLLLARGQAWVRYEPEFQSADPELADDPVPYETLAWETVRAERLHHEDFLHSPARAWEEVRWVARRAFLTRAELTARFGDIGAQVPLDAGGDDASETPDGAKKAAVWEIWDKPSRSVVWLARSLPARALDARSDPLGLTGFFPCPRPLFGTLGPGTLIPTPDYVYWQDQAEEIDQLTTRIDKLIEALRVRGFYSGAVEADLNTLLRADDATLIPVDSWAALGDAGGLKGVVDWFPVDQVSSVLSACFEARRQLIDDVWQLTGVSDIQRGASDPQETASAQQIKADWGSLRVREKQAELARFARDLVAIMGEVIAARFDPATLSAMTGVALPASSLFAEPGVPAWDQVAGLLRSPALRAFRIDIETDSTIAPDEQADKASRLEFVQAVGRYLADSLPVVQAAPPLLPVIAEGLKFLVRGFRAGRDLEETIDRAAAALVQAAANPPPAAPDPKAQAQMLHAQAAAQRVGVEANRVASDHVIGLAQVQAENARTAAQAMASATVQRAMGDRLVREINNPAPYAPGPGAS